MSRSEHWYCEYYRLQWLPKITNDKLWKKNGKKTYVMLMMNDMISFMQKSVFSYFCTSSEEDFG